MRNIWFIIILRTTIIVYYYEEYYSRLSDFGINFPIDMMY